MSLFSGWKGWRQFRKLPWDWRNIVIYSETGQDWHQFSGLIRELNENLDRKTCYVSSDARDPGLKRIHDNFCAIYIPEGLFQTIFFQVNRSDLFVLTMMDLDNLQLKRSLQPVHYVYLFHSMGSTHMVDHAIPLITTKVFFAPDLIRWRKYAGAKSSKACLPNIFSITVTRGWNR